MIKIFERNSTKITISEFYDNYTLNKYNFNAEYQRRGNIWEEDKKSFLIDSIFKNYPIPAIFMRPIVDKNGKTTYDVIDGKQRLETIVSFIENKIALTQYFDEDKFFDENNAYAAEKISGMYFEEIKKEKIAISYIKQFWTYALQVEYLYEDDTDLISSVFDRLNRNGEPLTQQELRNAKYSSNYIMKCIRELTKGSVFFSEKLSKLKMSRMEDEEIVSELLLLIIDNQILDSNPDKLNKKYEQYKSNKKKLDSAKIKFYEIIDFMESLNIDFSKNKRLYRSTHLYTLFTVCWYCIINNISSKSIKDSINKFYDMYFSPQKGYIGYFKDYKDAASSRTRSDAQRKKRMEAILKFCKIKIR